MSNSGSSQGRTRRGQSPDRTTTRHPQWHQVADAEEYAERLAAGCRRIEVRLPVGSSQDALIDLGAIPTDVQVKVCGRAAVRVSGGEVVVTDSAHVEAIGDAVVHAYASATVTAFGTASLTGRGRSRLTLCDECRAVGYDHTAIAVWDSAYAHGLDHATVAVGPVTDGQSPQIHLSDHAHLYTAARITVTGPARTHITHTPTPFDTAPADFDY